MSSPEQKLEPEEQLMEHVRHRNKVLYEEAQFLWKSVIEKTALKVQRADGDDVAAWLIICLKPTTLIKGAKKVTVEEKEEGEAVRVKNYTDTIEVDVAHLAGNYYIFVLEKTRESMFEPTKRERYIALVDASNREFIENFRTWIYSLKLPYTTEGERGIGRKLIELTYIVEGKPLIITVRRTNTKLIVHSFKLPDIEDYRVYNLL